ncbi:hypothetical protein NKH77_48475 [Streptomyces sp. M19]
MTGGRAGAPRAVGRGVAWRGPGDGATACPRPYSPTSTGPRPACSYPTRKCTSPTTGSGG